MKLITGLQVECFMYFWFLLSVMGLIAVIPLHFVSVNHIDLERRYGEDRGTKLGAALGMISGWGMFLFLFGLWISPQEHFIVPIGQDLQLVIPIAGLFTIYIPLVHLLISIVFILPGAWLGLRGVSDIGLKAAETHRSLKIVTTGVYSHIRHPQYLGAILSHIGITFLISAFYSLLVTPLVIIINWLLCWKEEKELVREFGEVYIQYKKHIPMLVPKCKKNDEKSMKK